MAESKQRAAHLFIAYAHEDEELRDKLAQHLAVLRNSGLIADWHDRQITAGEEWDDTIKEQLKKADIFLLLISASFLDSDYCMQVEFKAALERQQKHGVRVIPVIMRPALWTLDERLSQLQALPKDGKPVALWDDEDAALVDIATGITRVVVEIQGGKRSKPLAAPSRPAPKPAPSRPAARPKPIAPAPAPAAARPAPARRSPPRPARPPAISVAAKRAKKLMVAIVIATVSTALGALIIQGAYHLSMGALEEPPALPEWDAFRDVRNPPWPAPAGAACGLAFAVVSLRRGREGLRAEAIVAKGGGPATRKATGTGETKWRTIAGQVYERKEFYKAAYRGLSVRHDRSRAIAAVWILTTLAYLFMAISTSLVHANVGVRSGWFFDYLETITLMTATGAVTGFVCLWYRRRPGAKGGIWTALLIGGLGTLLCGLCYLLQIDRDTFRTMSAELGEGSGPHVFFGAGPRVTLLEYAVWQKMVILPAVATIVAVIICWRSRRQA